MRILLLIVATIRRITDTHYRHIPFHFSHNERTLFKFRCNIFIGVRIIKEMPGSVASGTPGITNYFYLCTLDHVNHVVRNISAICIW